MCKMMIRSIEAECFKTPTKKKRGRKRPAEPVRSMMESPWVIDLGSGLTVYICFSVSFGSKGFEVTQLVRIHCSLNCRNLPLFNKGCLSLDGLRFLVFSSLVSNVGSGREHGTRSSWKSGQKTR